MGQLPVKGQFKRCVRRVNGISVYVWDRDTVYATDGRQIRLYTRFGIRERYFYTKHWHKFVNYTKQANGLTLIKLDKCASKHEINIHAVNKLPADLTILPEKGKW